jgi:transposase-like protein
MLIQSLPRSNNVVVNPTAKQTVNLTKIRTTLSCIDRPYWFLTGSILLVSTPTAIAIILARAQFTDAATDPKITQTCAMSGIHDFVEDLRDRLYEYSRADPQSTIEHRPSTWRRTIDFTQPISPTHKTLNKVPFVFVSGGRLTTIHAPKPEQVAKIIDRNNIVAGIDGAFFMMHDSDSNQLVGPSLSQTDRKFHPGTAYEVMKSAGRPLVLMSADTIKFMPFDPKLHNTLEGVRSELPNVTETFTAVCRLMGYINKTIELAQMVKPYSIDLREIIVNAVEEGGSIRKVAQRFAVGKNLVQKLVTQLRVEGHVMPQKQGGTAITHLTRSRPAPSDI